MGVERDLWRVFRPRTVNNIARFEDMQTLMTTFRGDAEIRRTWCHFSKSRPGHTSV